MPESSEPPVNRTLMVVAAALGLALVVALAVAGIVLNSGSDSAAPQAAAPPATGSVPLVPVDAPGAGSAACAKLVAALPASLPNGKNPLARRPLAAPAPPAAAAWGAGDDPVVLRCGVEQPPEFKATSEVLGVDGVEWLKVDGDDAATWYAVDRSVCVALTLPGTVGTGPIQQVSSAIDSAMPAVPMRPAG